MSICGEKAWLPADHKDSDATYLISGDWDAARVADVNKPATSIGLTQNLINATPKIQKQLQIISSYYDLAQAENREMVEWLISDRTEDIRFRLRRLLWSQEVISTYSAVVVDCAPRFTTAVVQALAAATHILIPTKLDRASHEAVISFGRQVEILRQAGICSEAMHYAGVVGTMVNGNVEPLRTQLNDKLQASWVNGGLDGKAAVFDSNLDIVQNVIFRDAGGHGIAYFLMGENQQLAGVKGAIKRIASRVAQEMHLPHCFTNGGVDEVEGNARVA
jgi:cellulose biosynthesis protein BcsQ